MKITRRGFGRVATAGALGGVGLLAGALPCPAYAQRKVFKMKMGSPYPTTHPAGSRAVEVCDLIRKETNGAIDIEAFPNTRPPAGPASEPGSGRATSTACSASQRPT